MNQINGSEGEHMKFLTFGTSLNMLGHPVYENLMSPSTKKLEVRGQKAFITVVLISQRQQCPCFEPIYAFQPSPATFVNVDE